MDLRGADREKIIETLSKAGFAISEICCSRPSCFDFAARKDETLVLLKAQTDVSYLSLKDAEELETISSSISAATLLISKKGRDKPLEDDTVYTRHNISAITQKTLENYALRNTLPLMQANPGGCYVEIDGEITKRRRQELGLSIGKLAQMVGVSRRTLYGYERGMAKASVQTAYNLIGTLGVPIAKPVNLFEKPKLHSKFQILVKAKDIIGRNKLFHRIFKRFTSSNVTSVTRAPFDFVLTVHDKERIIGGFAAEREKDLDRRIQEILSISKIIHARPILLTHGQEPMCKTISCLQYDELAESDNPEDLIVGAI